MTYNIKMVESSTNFKTNVGYAYANQISNVGNDSADKRLVVVFGTLRIGKSLLLSSCVDEGEGYFKHIRQAKGVTQRPNLKKAHKALG